MTAYVVLPMTLCCSALSCMWSGISDFVMTCINNWQEALFLLAALLAVIASIICFVSELYVFGGILLFLGLVMCYAAKVAHEAPTFKQIAANVEEGRKINAR